MDYILDGTNLCINLSPGKKTALLPLFQVLLPLYRQGAEVICFFDANTQMKPDFDRWLYTQIASGLPRCNPLVAEETFVIVPPKDKQGKAQVADDQILQMAQQHPQAFILSFDNYRDERFSQAYRWSPWEANERVLTPHFHQDQLQFFRGEGEKVAEFDWPEGELPDLATDLLNLIEARHGRLVGRVTDRNMRSGLGKLMRRYTNMSRIHFRREQHDPAFNFAESLGQEVRFRLRFFQSKRADGSWDFNLNADGLTPLGSVAEENQLLQEENERLRAEVAALKAQLAQLSHSHQGAMGELQAREEEMESLYLKLGTLEEEIEVMERRLVETDEMATSAPAGLEEELADLRQAHDQLLSRYNRQQAALRLWRRQGSAQTDGGEISRALEALQQEMETLQGENARLWAQLKSQAGRPATQDGEALPPEVDPQPLLAWWHSLNDDWRDAFAHHYGLRPNEPDLVTVQRILSAREITLFGAQPFMFRALPFKLRELSGLAELKQLQVLNLSYNAISDLQPLADLPNLHRLLLIEAKALTSLKGLEQLPHLSYLDLSGTDVSEKEISWLKTHAQSHSLEIVF